MGGRAALAVPRVVGGARKACLACEEAWESFCELATVTFCVGNKTVIARASAAPIFNRLSPGSRLIDSDGFSNGCFVVHEHALGCSAHVCAYRAGISCNRWSVSSNWASMNILHPA